MIDIDGRIVAQVINFIILLWLLKRFLYAPITEMLDKRSDKINNDLDSASRAREEAEELKAKYQAEIKMSRDEAQKIIEKAEKRANERADSIINEAHTEAERIRKGNQEEIKRAKEEALDSIREEMAAISLMAAGKFMKENLKKKQHEKIIREYIDNIDDRRLGEIQ